MRLTSGKRKLFSVKGVWKGYQATMIKSKLKGDVTHSVSVTPLSSEGNAYASGGRGRGGGALSPQRWGANREEVGILA